MIMHDVYLCLHSSQIRSSKSTKKPTHATRRIIFTTVKNYDTIYGHSQWSFYSENDKWQDLQEWDDSQMLHETELVNKRDQHRRLKHTLSYTNTSWHIYTYFSEVLGN